MMMTMMMTLMTLILTMMRMMRMMRPLWLQDETHEKMMVERGLLLRQCGDDGGCAYHRQSRDEREPESQ